MKRIGGASTQQDLSGGRVVLDRREFLVKSAAAGAALAGGGLLRVPAAMGAGATGYAVDDKAPNFSGLDQYERNTPLHHLRHRWVLVDVCAGWCGPCNEAAAQYAGLIAEANGAGVPLSMLSVLREGNPGLASTRRQAESWAVNYGYERDWVLHCGGSSESPLFKLLDQVCEANHVKAAFPCHLLIDPTGEVRYFQQGSDTGKLQAELARAAGVTLSGDYSSGKPVPPIGPNIQSATISFGIQGGGTVSETVTLGTKGSNCTLSVTNNTGGYGIVYAFLTLAEGLTVDQNVPISVLLHPDQLRTYVQADPPAAEGATFSPLALWAGAPQKETGANLVSSGGHANAINLADGSGSGVSGVHPTQMEHGPDWGAAANVIELELVLGVTQPPYFRSWQLSEQAAGEGGSKKVQNLLSKGRKDMAHRDFAAAATALTQATDILGSGGDVSRHVSWLAKT
jgi:hypothetical protein